MIQLRDYQIEISEMATEVLRKKHLVYLAMGVRTGKTLTSLKIADNYGCEKVLFLTKKKAISSIEKDHKLLNPNYELTVTNYENLHNVHGIFNMLICDEAHVLSAYPKMSKRTIEVKKRFSHLPIIFLSGTPATESSSQWYNQLKVSIKCPFYEPNFYSFAKTYVDVTDRHLGYAVVKDYSKGKTELIESVIEPIVFKYTQEQAGFKSKVVENVIYCDMSNTTLSLIKKLKKDKFITGKQEEVIADTEVKLMSKLHQLSSGTIKFESGNSQVIDESKALLIKDKFDGKKIAIFYYFKEEYILLKYIFGNLITDNLDEFNNSDKSIALQQYSGAEGISLSKAEYLVFMNFGFSGVKFVQALDRLTTIDRLSNSVYFFLSNQGIDKDVYRRVSQKKNYTKAYFLRTNEFPK